MARVGSAGSGWPRRARPPRSSIPPPTRGCCPPPSEAGLAERLDRGTGADEGPVPRRVVHPSHRRPELLPPDPGGGEGGALPRVGPVPGVGGDRLRGVRRPLQEVVLPVRTPFLDLPDLLA